MRFLFALLLGVRLLAVQAQQQPCGLPALTVKLDSVAAYAVLDARGRVVIPYARRPLVVLTNELVKFSPAYTGARWGVLDRQNLPVLPAEYDEVQAASCTYVQGQKDGQSFLFDASGREVYRAAGHVRFTVLPELRRLLVARTGEHESGAGVQLLDLATKRVLYAQQPAASIYPLHLDLAFTPGRANRDLPFFEVHTSVPNTGGSQHYSRVLNAQGQVLFDSIDYSINADSRGAVYLRSQKRPTIVTDTMLRPIRFLSYQYDWVSRIGPELRWWAVAKGGKSGVLDASGRVLLPVRYPGQLRYTGSNTFLLQEYRGNVSYASFITADHRLIDLSDYYLEGGGDSTLGKRPLLLKNQKTYKLSLLDPRTGTFAPMPYELLERTADGGIFFQHDSAGYVDTYDRVRLLTPNCQILSAYANGYAVCGKLVPNATRREFPSAQIITSERGSAAAQYAYMDAGGKLTTGYFDWVGPFEGGYAAVIKNNEQYLIDPKGQRAMLPHGLALSSYFSAEGLALVQKGSLFGLADRTGRLVLPIEYRAIATDRRYSPGGQLVSKVNKGNTMLPITFPKLTQGQADVTTADGKRRQVAVPR